MRLKHEPEDFVVDEVPTRGFEESIAPEADRPFLVARARKRDCAHFDLLRSITQRFKVGEARVGIGGIKDRRAVTSQLLTLDNTERNRSMFDDGPVVLEPQTGEANLELVGSSHRRMTIGNLYGNRFSIVAREFTHDERSTLSKHRAGSRIRFPNYFGRQRFGRDLENVELGYALLTGDFVFVRDTLLSSSDDEPNAFVRRISRRKRMLMVSALQSAVFNAELIERVRGGVLERLEATGSGERVRELALIANECAYASSYDFDDELPVISLGADLTAFQQRLLDLIELSPRDFAIRSMPDIMFEPITRASTIGVELEACVLEDDALHVSFSLPKGSYATVFLEQMITN